MGKKSKKKEATQDKELGCKIPKLSASTLPAYSGAQTSKSHSWRELTFFFTGELLSGYGQSNLNWLLRNQSQYASTYEAPLSLNGQL